MPDNQAQATFQPNPSAIPDGGDSVPGRLDRVAELLSGPLETDPTAEQGQELVETPADDGQEPGAQRPPVETRDLDQLGERLGLAPDDLYSLEVRLPDGMGTKTLGELKDSYRAATQLDSQRQEYLSERSNYDADRLAWEREMTALLQHLPREAITSEVISRTQSFLQEQASRNEEALLRRIPDWADKGLRTAERREIADLLGKYGISQGEVNALQDYRLQQVFRRLHQLEGAERKRKAAEAKPAPKGMKPSAAKPATEAQQVGRIKAAVTTGRISRTEAVSTILERALARK